MGRMHRNQDGAVAILVAIILVGLAVPLISAGLSGYVRSGTAGELQRSADVGALAGARVIPLGDPEFVRTYLDSVLTPPDSSGDGPVGSLVPTFGGPDPLAVACDTALAALGSDSALGEDYSTTASCSAHYTADLDFVSDLQSCLTQLAGPPPHQDPIGPIDITPTPIPLPTITPLPLPTITPLPVPLPTVSLPPIGLSSPDEIDTDPIYVDPNVITDFLYYKFGNVVPALLKPGVRVELKRTTTGPVDDAVGDERAVATARRRFKNVVVVPIVETEHQISVGEPSEGVIDLNGDGEPDLFVGDGLAVDLREIDLNPALADSWEEIVGMVNDLDARLDEVEDLLSDGVTIDLAGLGVPEPIIDLIPPGLLTVDLDIDCDLALNALLDDLNDIYSPGLGDPPTQAEILADAEEKGEVVYTFIVSQDLTNPTLGLPITDPLGVLGVPFFDFVPVCLSSGEAIPTTQQAGCLANATGGFRASLVPNQ